MEGSEAALEPQAQAGPHMCVCARVCVCTCAHELRVTNQVCQQDQEQLSQRGAWHESQRQARRWAEVQVRRPLGSGDPSDTPGAAGSQQENEVSLPWGSLRLGG